MSADPRPTSGGSDGRGRRRPAGAATAAGWRRALAGLAPAVAGLALAGCAGAIAGADDAPPSPAAGFAAAVDPEVAAVLASSGAASLGVLGLSGDEVRRRLGPPRLRRRESWAEFWRYRLEPCVLDLYLYREPAGRRQHVLYAELRRDSHPARPDDCRDPVLYVAAGDGAL